jgi:hypothetical protein
MTEATKTNSKKKRKVIAIVLCLAMAATCAIGGAVAKYTTSVSGSDKASVAKWHFEVNDVNMTPVGNNANMTFDLFNTIMDSDGQTAEKDVKENLIAPGTSGAFDVKIENLSEVNAVYDLDFSVKNDSAIPVQFSTDGGKTWKTYDKLDELDVHQKAIGMETGAETVKVQWKWDFNGDNATDTALGIAAQTAAPEIEVSCTATFTQVD